MPSERIHLHITSDQFLDWYRGAARTVLAQAASGRTLRFPASILQQFVTKNGIHGTFDLHYDHHYKFQSIEPVGQTTPECMDLMG